MQARRISFVLVFAILLSSISGCGGASGHPTASSRHPFWGELLPTVQSPGETSTEEPEGGSIFATAFAEPLAMTVDQSTGDMTISRPELTESSPMGSGDWTIFVYLCGADLESGGGMATGDLEEMAAATGSDQVRFVVETGGAAYWYFSGASASEKDRFLVQNGEITLVDRGTRSGMGQSETLADFLRWGVNHYPAEHMGVILWDHGGGSISGVCFDELDRSDSLSLRELDAAFLSVFGGMTDRFEFVGFDACLMSTAETANILASYADYMIASEETEPGSGWDYTAMGNYLAAHPGCDGLELGKEICDSYMASCTQEGCGYLATMAVVDLRAFDDMLLQFNRFAADMFAAGEDQATLSAIVRGIENADNFGGNNRMEGYTNMVDLGGIVSACSGFVSGTQEMRSAIDGTVAYQVRGSMHSDACGLAVYYPLLLQGSWEMSIFSDICISPYYLSFIDRQVYGGANLGDTETYSDDHLFSGGIWSSGDGYTYDSDGDVYTYDDSTNDYWDYVDDSDTAEGESQLITFDVAPRVDDSGSFYFELDADGQLYTVRVDAYVCQISDDLEDFIVIGETIYVNADWARGQFSDDFDGYWLSLPDGQNLAIYIVEEGADCAVYTAPVRVNGEDVYLRLRDNYNGAIEVEGVWSGIEESGAAGRDLYQLQPGDVIVPLYDSFSVDDGEDGMYHGQEYTVGRDFQVRYALMEPGDYLYGFEIYDMFGDYYLTDFVMFSVDAQGNLYYTDLSE